MSGMNFLEKLLDGVAVEWKPLGKLAENLDFMRKAITSGLRDSGEVPYYGASGIVDYVKDYIFDGDFLLVSEDGANLVARNTPIAFSISGKTWVNNHAHILKFNTYVERRYIEYYLNSIDLTPYISGAAQPKLNQNNLNSIKIPNPSLAIQAEIVRILDTFTVLTAELTAELTDRRKQYNYYRDRLLTFEEGEVEWKAFGDLTLPTRNIRWKETDRPYRYIDLTSVSRENNLIIETSEITALNAPSRAQKLVEKDDVIFATTRPTQLRLCLINEEYSGEVASTGYCVLRANADEILPKWIYHHLSSLKFFNYVEENQSGSAYPAISDSKIKEFKLPIPYPSDPVKSLAEQARIVAILDKFDTLTHSISEGLPREITLRQKQYEYYRDLLLTFPKSEEVEA